MKYPIKSFFNWFSKFEYLEKWFAAGQNIANGGGMTDDNEIINSLVPAWFDMENQNGYIGGWMDMIKKYQVSPDP